MLIIGINPHILTAAEDNTAAVFEEENTPASADMEASESDNPDASETSQELPENENVKDGQAEEKQEPAGQNNGSAEEKQEPAEENNRTTAEEHQEPEKEKAAPVGSVTETFQPDDEIPGIPEGKISDTPLVDLINKIQLLNAEADVSACALFNDAGNLYAGDVDYDMIAGIYPYDNKLYRIAVTGKELKNYMEWTAEYYNQWVEGDINISFNPDFPVYLFEMFAGVDYEVNLSKPVGERIENVMFKGKPLADDQKLTLAVSDYTYSSALQAKKLVSGNPEWKSQNTVRDMIIEYFGKKSPVSPETDQNWSITGIFLGREDPRRAELLVYIREGLIPIPYNTSYNLQNYQELVSSAKENMDEQERIDLQALGIDLEEEEPEEIPLTEEEIAENQKKQIEDLKEQSDDILEQKAELEEKNKALEKEKRDLKSELRAVKSTLNEKDARLKDVQASSAALEETNRLLEEEKAALEETNRTLEGEKTELTKAREALEEEKTGLEGANKTLEGEKAALQEEKAELEETSKALEEEKAALQEKLAGLEKARKTLEEEKAALLEEKEGLEENNRTLEEEKAALQEEKEGLEENNRTLTEEKASLEKEKKTLEGEKAALEKARTSLETEKAGLEEKNSTLESEKSSLEEEKAQANEKITQLGEKITALNTEKDNLSGQVDTLSATVEELTEKNYQLRLEVDPGQFADISGERLSDSEIFYTDSISIGIVQKALADSGFSCPNTGRLDEASGAAIDAYAASKGFTAGGHVTEEVVQALAADGKITDLRVLPAPPAYYETWLRYERLAEIPQNYYTTKAQFEGKVLQAAMPSDGKNGCIRMAVNSDNSKVVFLTFKEGAVDSLEEGDIINIYGRGFGTFTYTSAAGQEYTIPWLFTDMIEKR